VFGVGIIRILGSFALRGVLGILVFSGIFVLFGAV